jgi:hypothetical protein
MTYSKIHQAFSERLNQPDVLTHPAKYLGPNWKDVLNFWIYVDTLSDEEKKKMYDRYQTLEYTVRDSSINVAMDVAHEVIGWGFSEAAWDAARGVTGWGIFGNATDELFAHHILLEQNKTPLALQYCIKL